MSLTNDKGLKYNRYLCMLKRYQIENSGHFCKSNLAICKQEQFHDKLVHTNT